LSGLGRGPKTPGEDRISPDGITVLLTTLLLYSRVLGWNLFEVASRISSCMSAGIKQHQLFLVYARI
jgi:hypothetical protein